MKKATKGSVSGDIAARRAEQGMKAGMGKLKGGKTAANKLKKGK
jgi:hypothetical protein